MLLTKTEIFERLKEEGVDMGNDPFRTFLYYQETGLIPRPEGKKKNAYLFPDYTIKSIKMIKSLQKKGESIPAIKKRYNGIFEQLEIRQKNLEEAMSLICEAFNFKFNLEKYYTSSEYGNDILEKYGEFVKELAIAKLKVQHKFLEDGDIKDALLIKKTA